MELESAHACGGLLMEGEKRENTTCDEWKKHSKGDEHRGPYSRLMFSLI